MDFCPAPPEWCWPSSPSSPRLWCDPCWLVLLLALNEFGIVLFTGAKEVVTLPVLIYTRGIVTFDLPGAAVLATIQVVLSLALYGLYRIIFSRMLSERAATHPKGF